VGTLGAGGSSAESISLAAPSSAGAYYYGACVDAVTGESSTSNNCSDGVEVEVSDGGAGDDHGDDIGSATRVSVPSTTDGELEEGGDRDYFRLLVSEDTTLTVETTGSTDTFGTLFDATGTSLETDDDGGAGTNFEIERDVDAGTYYVEVRGFSSSTTGTYQLDVSDEDGGGSGSAVTVEVPGCSASRDGNFIDVIIRTTITANRTVSSVRADGYVNNQTYFIDSEFIGDMTSGQSRSVILDGSFFHPEAITIRCSVDVTWIEASARVPGAGSHELQRVRRLSRGGMVR